jgi:ribonuclease H2 subunit A
MEPIFGFPSLVRFSWATVKIILDKDGHAIQWYVLDLGPVMLTVKVSLLIFRVNRTDETQTSLIKAFESGSGADKGRCALARELGIHSVGNL